ncbi:D-alanyl-D-alanine carboxypeptidase family protein [Streptomyces goshikiensis]|uniref:D-alanyl-D-alanine carboxypeptidase family protein n=1 Tax=Streptomyces goshikiensis TaxID=1942 RepID=UPI0036B5FFE0
MAGESPDKSVDEGAVGEGRDPRVSVFRPRDPEPESEAEAVDPLREAVAAWVASEAGSDSEAEPDSDAESGEAAEAVSGSGSPGRVEPKPSADDAEERTAVFRAVKRDSAPAKPAATEEPAESERTAVFRAPKPAEAKPEPKPEPKEEPSASASAKPASGAEKRDSASVKPAAADQRTTAFGVVKPAATGEPADSERTAVFRAPKPVESKPEPSASSAKPASDTEKKDSASVKPAAADQRTTAFGVVKPAATGEPADSERTAVFRAPKPADAKPDAKPDTKPESSASAPAKPAPGAEKRDSASAKPTAAGDEPADSERTAVFRAVKPADAAKATEAAKAAKAAAPAKPAPAKPAAAGGSTFVPLRGDGAAAPKAPAEPRPPQASAPRVSLEPGERTTQQPLPPKPPLDMLADLTNNPPPPPSPLRTAVRRFKIYAPVVVLLAVILAVVQLVRPLPDPKLTMTAKKTYTFDGGAPEMPWPKEGQAYMAAAGLGTVGTFGEQKPVAIGSVAKAMTAYVILKGHPLKKGEKGAMIDVDKAAVEDGKKESEGESTVNTLKEGGQISEYDALAAIMIPSANNVARLLARWDAGGDQEAFVKKMNDAAKELGMTNTTYTDPSGLDATTVSTAEDQVKLGLKIVEMPELIAITRLPNWTDASGKSWRNYNDLIPYNGSLGIKTGSTTKAGGNLLFAAEKKVGKTNQLVVGAVLGQHGVPILGTAIDASRQVMLATQKMLTNAPVVKKGDVVGYVDNGLGGHTPVIATADVEAVGWPALTVKVKLGDDGAKLPQTARAGTEVGVLTVGEGASQVKVPVALKSDLVAPGVGSKLTRVG